jgi:hypothetical protein
VRTIAAGGFTPSANTASLGNEKQLASDSRRPVRVGGHKQHCVIPSDSSDDIADQRMIDGRSQEVGPAWRSSEYCEISRRVGRNQQFLKTTSELLKASVRLAARNNCSRSSLGCDGIRQVPVFGANPHRTQLIEIPRQGRLGHIDTVVGKQASQLGLRSNLMH